MVNNKFIFKDYSANENNSKWNQMIKREQQLYSKPGDIRSPFERDFNRILHSNAYNRLKHKTQVFFSPENDHISTRIEHVNYVESISYTIANYLGLNSELTRAIACGHDVGHGPFGHKGERIISEISKRELGKPFWHEQNGLNIVDDVELLDDYEGNKKNLNLTYAVRDGIISHCGEIDENSIKPRDEAIDLNDYTKPNEYAPFTWEGCIVKVSDKISYLGRDIDDAIEENFFTEDMLDELSEITGIASRTSNSAIINTLVTDICENSSPEDGIRLSKNAVEMMNKLKAFNYKYIYGAKRMTPSNKYFELVINQIFDILNDAYDGANTPNKIMNMAKFYPNLMNNFYSWIEKYWNFGKRERLKNKVIFDIDKKEDYIQAIIYYISGMTDKFAVDMYNEIIHF